MSESSENQTPVVNEDANEMRFRIIEEKINALSRLMTLMLIFVLTVTLVLFLLHWAGHALSHTH
ncbi:MAG: hypothetical protein ACPGQS_10900 [Bradymonadia bacterium]